MESFEGRTDLASLLRKFRTESGYSQNQIANVLGIERSTYTYYETGKTVPIIFDLIRMANLYGITVDDLVGAHTQRRSMLHDSHARFIGPDRTPVEALQDLSEDERQLIAYYRSASKEERETIMEFLYGSRKNERRRVPR